MDIVRGAWPEPEPEPELLLELRQDAGADVAEIANTTSLAQRLCRMTRMVFSLPGGRRDASAQRRRGHATAIAPRNAPCRAGLGRVTLIS